MGGAVTLALMALGAGACPARPEPASAAHPEVTSDKYNRWEPEISAFERADQKQMPAAHGILFAGSSSIRMWKLGTWFPGLKLINRGFGGSEIDDSTHFAPRIILKYRPRLIVFYAGDNDVNSGKTPERVLSDFKAFTSVVNHALPRTRIVFLSIKPSLARLGQMETQQRANRLVEAYCNTDRRLRYVDVATPMLDATGKPRPELFLKDGLHLNNSGYAIWTQIVRPLLR